MFCFSSRRRHTRWPRDWSSDVCYSDLRFIQEDVETVELSPNSFDTIISSASVCAYQDPIHVLNNFQKWCKPEAKILLLEHGICTKKTIGWLQKISNRLSLILLRGHQDMNITEIVKKINSILISYK